MVSLGFFDVAGQNDLPFLSTGLTTSGEVSRNLLSYTSAVGMGDVALTKASLWNLPLCRSCISHEDFPASTLYKHPELQETARRLNASVATGVSSETTLQAWLSGPRIADSGSSCWTACAPLPQTANFFAGGFERPYGPNYSAATLEQQAERTGK